MPFVSAHLPENPTANDRPWLAMPIATPLGDALASEPFETVVDAVEALAEARARLEAELGVAHRDV